MPAFSAVIRKPDSLVDSIKTRLQKLIFHTETLRELQLIHHFSASQPVGLNLFGDRMSLSQAHLRSETGTKVTVYWGGSPQYEELY